MVVEYRRSSRPGWSFSAKYTAAIAAYGYVAIASWCPETVQAVQDSTFDREGLTLSEGPRDARVVLIRCCRRKSTLLLRRYPHRFDPLRPSPAESCILVILQVLSPS